MVKLRILMVIAPVILAGCVNVPTPPSEIKGIYISSLRYEAVDCPRLSVEFDSLVVRESRLVLTQQQRIEDSGPQEFWYGVGKGDGIEANELAIVRGEKEAIQTAMQTKRC
jgi:hypothetical protein